MLLIMVESVYQMLVTVILHINGDCKCPAKGVGTHDRPHQQERTALKRRETALWKE